MKQGLLGLAVLVAGATGLVVAPVAWAATTADSKLTQEITAGALNTSIRDGSGLAVTAPSFPMSSTTVSNTAVQTTTGTFGDTNQRITVDNPGFATNGWTLVLAGATSAAWNDGAKTYPYNAATSDAGQLTVNPAVGTVTPVFGGTTGVTLGSSATYNGTVTAITLMQAGAAAASTWNGYVTGIGLSQTIPVSTPVGSYKLDMVQTVTAI